MKRFFAFWVVSIVMGVLLGLVIGVVDSLFAEVYVESWRSPLYGCCYSPRYLPALTYSFFGLVMAAPGYLIFRIVVGSLKIVFGKNP